MQVLSEYPLVRFEDQLKCGELMLFPQEQDHYLGMKVIREGASDPRLLILGKIGEAAPSLRLWRDDAMFPRYVLVIDKVAQFVPDLSSPRPRTPRPVGTLYLGQKVWLTVADDDRRQLVDVHTGRYDPGTQMNIEYPVGRWSILLEHPRGPVELLRHEPAQA